MRTATDVVCPFCGTLCDDIEVDVDDAEKICATRNACIIGDNKFMTAQAPDRHLHPRIRRGGELVESTMDEAINKAAEILVNAKHPLLYGWSSTHCEAQEAGMALAEGVGGTMDNTSVCCHGPSVLAIHTVGISSCTLGEIINRADIVLYWGCNPVNAHPRHMSRYSLYKRGFFTERGKSDRTEIVIDVRRTETAQKADIFLQPEQGRDYELMNALRVAFRGGPLPESVAGIPRAEIEKVAQMLKDGRFGILFFGMGLTMTRGKHRNIDIAISLTADLNTYTKFLIMAMRGHYNVAGADQVSLWECGFPYAVDFARGFPRYNPGESSATDILARKEADAALIIAADPGAHFPIDMVRTLASIPMIAIDPHVTPTTEIASVHIPSAIVGIEDAGSAYRMDNVPIRMRKVVEPPEGVLTDQEIIERIHRRVMELQGLEVPEVTAVKEPAEALAPSAFDDILQRAT
ncbi:MAG: formylmethanofuran dehydrogenase subunit B [Halobacteriota archaeon]|jgi:formylmethanofuran dehydrogenase subunit B